MISVLWWAVWYELSEVYTVSIFKVEYRNINIKHIKHRKYRKSFHVVARIADFI